MAGFDPFKSQMLTDAGNVSRTRIANTVLGMAHFAGTGPLDKTCGDCAFWQSMPKKSTQHCAKFQRMANKGRAMKPVPHSTWACRHFEQR